MYSYEFRVNCSGVYMNDYPEQLRTSLNTSYTPYTLYSPNVLNRVKHFEPLGISHKLKEIDFNSVCYAWETYHFEPIEPIELLKHSNNWNNWNG